MEDEDAVMHIIDRIDPVIQIQLCSSFICSGPSYSHYPLRAAEMDVFVLFWWRWRVSWWLVSSGFSLWLGILLLQTIKIRDPTAMHCLTFKQIFFSSKIPSFPTEYTSLNFKLITTIQEDWDWITRAFQIYWNPKLCASHLSWIKWISSNIHGKCFRTRQLILVSHLTALNVFCFYT